MVTVQKRRASCLRKEDSGFCAGVSGTNLQDRHSVDSGIAFFRALAKNAATIQARHPARRNAADGQETDCDRGLTPIQLAANRADRKRSPPKTAASGAGPGVTRLGFGPIDQAGVRP
jgi:hypothetical protein